MAGSINRAEILGNLGRDPEIRKLNDGSPVASFSIATSERWTNKETGEKKERTDWHNIVCFNPGLCDVIEKYLKKGSKVYVSGKLQTRKWQDQSGTDRYTTEVVLQRFGGELVLLGDAAGGGGRPAPSEDDYGTTRTRDSGESRSSESWQAPPQAQGGGSARYDLDGDDLPF